METFKSQLETYTELHWWNGGRKTLSFQGTLKDLLKNQSITYTKRKSDREGLFNYTFKNNYGITFKYRGTINDFSHLAKQMIQMELVRMGDKSQLYVSGCWRPTVTVNF